MRLDKWLWVARFYKTRSLAATAVEGGKVKVNHAAAKPAKDIKPNDLIQLRAGEQHWTVTVLALADHRRPAAEAQLLYQETEESARERARAAELRKLAPTPGQDAPKGRPTKRDRRQLARVQAA